ncbi:hypothetical protein AT959_13095 [Dechloromonas denitrificans]|uniref:tRNA(Ile)-lysidine synthetase n=1 Tax=Dechloromonas denitrificans TaxID=281362 RepID=A0A133XH64_9RHOO|nr:hypothetical protein AT959_13095 [Dechloromonas denitrificans]
MSPNADEWAAFCADYCRRLAVVLDIAHVAVDRQSGLGLEAAARQARYAALANCNADSLLLAHHQGDQAETVLFNLLRGAGVAGAAGMPVERPLGARRLLRPLLAFSRAEIEDYARQQGLAWIDDESNIDLQYSRNFLRHEILPRLSARFPQAEASLALAASHFGETDQLLAELAAVDWQKVQESGGQTASLHALRGLSLPRLKNLLRYRLRELGWRTPVASRLEEFARQLLTAAPDRHPELQLPEGCLRIAQGRVHWLAQK